MKSMLKALPTLPFFLLIFTCAAHAQQPRLVVMFVIDQFRADTLTRFQSRFLPAKKGNEIGGFRYLMDHGAYYQLGEYDVLQSMTCVGHATVLTGSYPYQNGIALNDWYDRETKTPRYCVDDPNHGKSPLLLNASTVGDELKNAGHTSKVIGIALKDRSAILMSGKQADLAIWFDGKANKWITSDYYTKKLPDWVEKLNKALPPLKEKIEWKAEGPGTGLSLKENVVKEEQSHGMGAKFPHTAEIGTRAAVTFPYSVDLTIDAAEAALSELKLGLGKSPDLLAVSISTHDMVGHIFGPNSREVEEITVHEDRALSKFLNTLNQKVPGGLKNVLFVMTADHGIPSHPDFLKSQKQAAGRIDEKELKKSLNERLAKKFGTAAAGGEWVVDSYELNLYLNREAIAAKNLSPTLVEDEVRNALINHPGVAFVFTATDYAKRILPPGMHGRQILKTYIPSRNGDIVAIPKPYFMVSYQGTTHHTGYSYDRYVPIVFAGPGIRPGRYTSRAEVVDIAPTLSFILGLVPPNMSEGRVLGDALIAGSKGTKTAQ